MNTLTFMFTAVGLVGIATTVSCGGSHLNQESEPISASVPAPPLSRHSDGTVDWKGLVTFTGESPGQILSHVGENLPGMPESNLSEADLAQEIDAQVSIQCDAVRCIVQPREPSAQNSPPLH